MSDSISDIRERLGELSAKAGAAHGRLDRLEIGIREDLKGIQDELKAISAWMNRGKGWAAAALLIAGAAGAAAMELAKSIVHK